MPINQRSPTKQELSQIFNQTDAVLEPSNEPCIEKYINSGGNLSDACEAAMDSYAGTPDMIRVLIDWGNLYGDGEATLESAVESVLIEHEQKIIPRLEEAFATTDDPQPLISSIISSQRWNSVVKDMANRFNQSALHNLVTRESRLSEAGVSQNVLNSPEKFLDDVTHQIQLFENRPSITNQQLSDIYKRIAAVSTYDECSTLVALRYFSSLYIKTENEVMRGFYKRIAQEIETEAVKLINAAALVSDTAARHYILKLAMVTTSISWGIVHPKEVADSLLIISTPDRTCKRRYERESQLLTQEYSGLIGSLDISDEVKIISQQSKNSHTYREKVVLIRMICHYEILTDIIKSVFSYEYRSNIDGKIDGKADGNKRRCLCLLLSYAGIFIHIDDNTLHMGLQDKEITQEWCKQVGELYKRLYNVIIICEELKPGCLRSQMKETLLRKLLDAITDPILAKGILIWAKEGLYGGCDLRDLLVTCSKHLAFLEAIASKHFIFREEIMNIIHKAFKREYISLEITEIEQLRDKFMMTILHMMKFDMNPQFIDLFLEKWVKDDTVDNAHIRKFTIEFMKIIAPPYSKQFAQSIATLLDNRRVSSILPKDSRLISLIKEFRSEQMKMNL